MQFSGIYSSPFCVACALLLLANEEGHMLGCPQIDPRIQGKLEQKRPCPGRQTIWSSFFICSACWVTLDKSLCLSGLSCWNIGMVGGTGGPLLWLGLFVVPGSHSSIFGSRNWGSSQRHTRRPVSPGGRQPPGPSLRVSRTVFASFAAAAGGAPFRRHADRAGQIH